MWNATQLGAKTAWSDAGAAGALSRRRFCIRGSDMSMLGDLWFRGGMVCSFRISTLVLAYQG